MIKIQKGTKDILPQDVYKWHYVESTARELAKLYNFKEIRTPTFEATELFARGMGESSDVVNKEMYTFIDKGERSITLKPEGTAGVVRSYIENGLSQLPSPLKLFYITPVFRYEKPQNGRLREHHQFGVELFGSSSVYSDFEVLMFAHKFLKTVGLDSLTLNVNSIGCENCRPKYNEKLKRFLASKEDCLCEQCKKRKDTNPLRIFDCKETKCNSLITEAPKITDYLCDECKAYFKGICELLDKNGIKYVVNNKLVRGLDYYTKFVFEFTSNDIGAQGTVCGGGRYNNLIAELGGQSTPGIGFGLGIERLLLVLENTNKLKAVDDKPDVYIATYSAECRSYAMKLALDLREVGVSVEYDIMERSLKAQLKHADKVQSKYLIIIGEDEIKNKGYKVKNMGNGNVENVKDLVSFFGGIK